MAALPAAPCYEKAGPGLTGFGLVGGGTIGLAAGGFNCRTLASWFVNMSVASCVSTSFCPRA